MKFDKEKIYGLFMTKTEIIKLIEEEFHQFLKLGTNRDEKDLRFGQKMLWILHDKGVRLTSQEVFYEEDPTRAKDKLVAFIKNNSLL